jgi:hypothetical protein
MIGSGFLSLTTQIRLERLLIPVYLGRLLCLLIVAWFLAPVAVHLSKNPANCMPKNESKMARKFAVLATIAIIALEITIPSLENSFFDQHLPLVPGVAIVVAMIASVVTAFPYSPLFVALSLIAGNTQSTRRESQTVAS